MSFGNSFGFNRIKMFILSSIKHQADKHLIKVNKWNKEQKKYMDRTI